MNKFAKIFKKDFVNKLWIKLIAAFLALFVTVLLNI